MFLLLGVFMNLLDATIVTIALPSIEQRLGASHSALHWVMAIYVLAFAAGLLPFGRLGDVLGRRKMFILGLSVFTLASLICGLAADVDTLITARFFQGLGGAMMTPQVLAIIHVNFPSDEKAKAIGAFGMVSGMAAASGPVIGGILIAVNLFDLGWRLVFLINVPIGVIAIFGALKNLPLDEQSGNAKIDWLGALLFTIIIATFTYPLIEAETIGWSIWLFVLFGISAALCGVFWRWQLHLACQNKMQTLPVSLMQKREFLQGITYLTLLFTGIAGVFVTLAITLQSGMKLTPLNAGLVMAAHPTGAMLAAMLTGKFGQQWLLQRIIFGVVLLLIGMVWLQLQLSLDVDKTKMLLLWPPLLSVGIGIGTATVAMFQYLLSFVAPKEAGAGSGVMQTFQQIGILLSIVLVGQIFFAFLGDDQSRVNQMRAMAYALWLPIGIFTVLSIIAIQMLIKRGVKS
jgi:EmrB/QacA subfamily drug resistance transporter